MARFTFTGVDELVAQYERLGKETRDMIGHAVYEGAKIVADGLKAELEGLPTDDTKHAQNERKRAILTIQRQGLVEGLGVAPMKDDDGFVNVKIGFDGYNKLKTKKYPNGQPNALIARSLEAGTSYLERDPVISRTANKLKKKCEQAMQDSLDRDYKAVTE